MNGLTTNFSPKRFLLLFFITVIIAGCSYYKVYKTDGQGIIPLIELGDYKKNFVLHQGDDKYILTNIEIKDQILTGSAAKYFSNLSVLYSEKRKKKRVHKEERSIFHEVHIYLNNNDDVIAENGNLKVPIVNIDKVHIVEKNSGRSVAMFILGTIGAFVTLAAIVAATKDSCPYVYVHDGDGFVFLGETYGGAIASNLERHDFMPLPKIKPVDGFYKIRISNELKEIQHTNLANLLVVEHPEDSQVLIDRKGKTHIYHHTHLPISATSESGKDKLPQIQTIDNKVFSFDELDENKNRLHLTFQKTSKNIKEGKLVLHGKNTPWFDFLVSRMFSNLGGHYESFMAKEKQRPAEERLKDFRDKGIMLDVFVKKDNGWEYVDYLPTIGPMATRDFIMPIDLENISGENIEIRIETGFMFWELDQVKMDFSQENYFYVNELLPSIAIDHDGKNHTQILAFEDAKYLKQPNVGDVIEIHFPKIEKRDGYQQTIFLHSKGYYEPIREYEGLPDLTRLLKLKQQPDYFSQYSKETFLEHLEGNEIVVE